MNSGDGLVFQTPPEANTIFPTPCIFDSANLPRCAVVRPTSDALAGPVAFLKALVGSGLFIGQVPGFFTTLNSLAAQAEAARRPA